ncbi:MAG TPA: ABC transporter ATP-binding protein [Rhodospirillales bacterium]|nr:ABC transporter ATP-binding protein [Rhodospirillales bacterium]
MLIHIRHLWELLDQPARRKGVFIFFTMIIGGVLEVLGIGLILPILQIAVEPADALQKSPWLAAAYEGLNFSTQRAFMIALCSLVFLIYLFKNIFGLYLIHIQYLYTWNLLTDYSRRLFRHYLHATYATHVRRSSGLLLRNVNITLIGIFKGMMMPVLMIATEVLLSLSILGFLIWLSPWVALTAVGVLALAAVIFLKTVRKRVKYWGERNQVAAAEMLQWPNQAFSGFKQIKALGRENYFDEAFGVSTEENANCQRRFQLINNTPRAFLEILAVGGILLSLVVILVLEYDLAKLIPVIGAFSIAILRIMPSANRIITQFNSLKQGIVAMETIYDDIKDLPLISDVPKTPAKEPMTLGNELRIENVHFTYDGSELPAVHDINLTIPKGSSVAFVGASGAGKSTLVDLLLGLLDPTSGRILADGVDISTNHRSWRDSCGYIPQEVFLLNDTLRNNIALGIATDQIDEDAITKSIELAHLGGVVENLPDGLDTVLGENGVRMSGGQRQRVSIARALYHNPDILILDEATAALDNKTEKEVSDAINLLGGEKTLIIIAHRLSTVRHCDRIVLLDGGKIVDSGAFEELAKSNAYFKRMVKLASLDSEHTL